MSFKIGPIGLTTATFFFFFIVSGPFFANAQQAQQCLPAQPTSEADSRPKTETKKKSEYKVVAAIKGGAAGIPGINEVYYGCTPPAFARGLWYLIAQNDPGGIKKIDIEDLHKGLQESLGFIPEWTKTEEQPEDYIPGTPGPNRNFPWAVLKDKYARTLGYEVKTTRVGNPTPNPAFFEDLIKKIKKGFAIEIQAITPNHMSFISEIVQYDNGDYGLVFTDDLNPDGGKPATQKREPLRFNKEGVCISKKYPKLKIANMFWEEYKKKL